MKRPNSLNEFIDLVNGMDHRERFVFPAKPSFTKKYGHEVGSIEIYNTILFNSKNMDRNITIHLVDATGEVLNKKARLHRLWDSKFFESVYVMILEEINEVLELPE